MFSFSASVTSLGKSFQALILYFPLINFSYNKRITLFNVFELCMHGFEFLGIHFRFQVVHALCMYELKNEHCLSDFPCSVVTNFCNVLFLFFFLSAGLSLLGRYWSGSFL